MRRRRHLLSNVLASLGALALLVLVLVAVDDRVRDQFALRMSDGRPPAELARAGVQMRDMMTVIAEVVHDQTVEHGALMVFVVAGTALTLMMIRT
jgi:hypothetical protein